MKQIRYRAYSSSMVEDKWYDVIGETAHVYKIVDEDGDTVVFRKDRFVGGSYWEIREKSIKENKMKKCEIREEDVQRAWKNGCEETRKILKDLFPRMFPSTPKYESLDKLTSHVKENDGVGGMFIELHVDGVRVATSKNDCKISGGSFWVAFPLESRMVVHESGNFLIER